MPYDNIDNQRGSGGVNNLAGIPVIVGPTASGKTRYAVNLAKEIGAEIVSADSMQIYRYMDIGTAKATLPERAGIPHHMIDIVDPDKRFSVADYKKMALECIDAIIARGRKVVVVGGTGLYISALIYNIRYPGFAADPAYRERLSREALSSGSEALYSELCNIDPEAAIKIHAHDLKRIIRALEIYRATGKRMSEHERLSLSEPPQYTYDIIGLNAARDELYRRIDARVDQMFERGLLDEARALLERYGSTGTASQAIGYKELFSYLNGEYPLCEAIQKIKSGTRHYAKRQMTWFRRMPGVKWIDSDITGR